MVYTNPENAATNTYVVAEVTDDEAITKQTLSEESLKNGREWAIRDNEEISTTTDLEIFVGVPSDADDVLRIVSRDINPDDAVEGEVTFNRDGLGTGTQASFINSQVDGNIADSFPVGSVETGGNYTNPAQRNGSTIELPIRSALGVDPEGPIQAETRPPETAVFRVAPGGSVHYRIGSVSSDTNTVEFEFIVSQRGTQ